MEYDLDEVTKTEISEENRKKAYERNGKVLELFASQKIDKVLCYYKGDDSIDSIIYHNVTLDEARAFATRILEDVGVYKDRHAREKDIATKGD